MKVRKLAVAMALAGGLSSGLAHALGMGEGEILTRLNEPLRAEIELTRPGDVSMDEIKVGLASEDEFERFGIRRMGMLHQLEFDVVRGDDNKLVVEVTSDEPIREPFLKMLLELTWPNGRLMREYSFLVDPPERSGGADAAGPEGDGGGQGAEASAPEASGASEDTASSGAGQSGGQAEEREAYGPTSANDTLWSIAGRVDAPGDASRQQVMLALQEANPNAFANGNINQLRQGQVLRLPSEQEIRARSTQEAVQEVMAQNESHRSRRGEPAAEEAVADSGDESNGQGAGAGETAGAQSGDDELRILVADNESGNGEGDIAGMGDGEGDEELDAALEELDRAERDREELESRLGDLEEQIDTMAELIELKDDQLAEMQQRLSEADGDTEIPEDPEAGEDSDQTEQAAAEDDDTEEDSDTADVAAAAGDEGPDPDSDQAAEPEGDGSGEGQEEQASEEAGAADEAPEDQEQAAGTEQEREQTGMPDAPTTVGGFFDRLVREPLYQVGAGVIGIVLLLFLWALARRSAAREKAFYDQIRDISGDEQTEDVLDLEGEGESPDMDEASVEGADEAESEKPESGDDVLAEVDFYMAYGRYGQAAQHLEEAISEEPSRTDLRLKLLEVYAGAGDSETFEKQYRELSALGDDSAIEKADALREQIADTEEDLSIDDLAEQLKTGTGSDAEASVAETEEDDDSFDFSALEEADELLAEDGTTSTDAEAQSEEHDFGLEEDFGFDDEAFERSMEESSAEESNDGIDFEYAEAPSTEEAGTAEPESGEEDVEDLGFSLEDLELEEPEPEAPAADTSNEESSLNLEDDEAIPDASDFADLSMDEEEIPVAETDADTGEEPGEPLAEEEPEPLTEIEESVEEQETPEAEDAEAFDDSFLEELDAELDKVTEEESSGEAVDESAAGEAPAEEQPVEEPETEASIEELGDLELDVSDDDLALMDELTGEDASEAADEATASGEQSGDELLDADLEETGADETLSEEEKAALEGEEIPTAESEAEETVAQESAGAAPAQAESESTGSDEDDEFDFLEGTDEAGTKLDLARAYVEMGDAEGARDILEEVSKEGNDEQQQEAQRLLNEL